MPTSCLIYIYIPIFTLTGKTFSSLPPLTTPIFLASYQNPEKRMALHDAVKEMEIKRAIEVVRTPSPGFYSRLFLVPKAGGTWRPIIDLSVLNTHIQCPSFKMETNGSLLKALQKGQWLTILDLKDANTFTSPFTPPTGSTSGSATRAWFGNSELFLLG